MGEEIYDWFTNTWEVINVYILDPPSNIPISLTHHTKQLFSNSVWIYHIRIDNYYKYNCIMVYAKDY